MSYAAEIARFMMIESRVEAYFAAHLSTATGLEWRTPLSQAEDIGSTHHFLSVQMDGSVDTFAPAAQSHTGQPERNVFNVTMQLAISTTFHEVDQDGVEQDLNKHQYRVGLTRAAMLHGALAGAAQCPQVEIIGWLMQGATNTQISETDDILTVLTYTFQVGYKADAWPEDAEG